MVSMTASAAAAATGLPPKVVPWLPGPSRDPAAPTATVAPIGKPPPSPLASVTTSGVTPEAWWAIHAPVRPIPDCTSSTQSRAPCALVISRARARKSSGGKTTPASP